MEIISRKLAKQQGLKWYFTGKPCPKGHICYRSVATYQCRECVELVNTLFKLDNPNYKKDYYQPNKEYCKQYNKSWQRNNPDKRKQNMDKYVSKFGGYSEYGKYQRLTSSEVYQKSSKLWRQRFPHKVWEHSKIRRTRLEMAILNWFKEEEHLVASLYRKRDELNELWGTQLEVDHIIPINPRCKTVCGLHCWSNLQLLDRTLNGSKHDIYQTDW